MSRFIQSAVDLEVEEDDFEHTAVFKDTKKKAKEFFKPKTVLREKIAELDKKINDQDLKIRNFEDQNRITLRGYKSDLEKWQKERRDLQAQLDAKTKQTK